MATSYNEPEKTIRCHYYQSRALSAKNRFVALIAGTGGGKTYTGPLWLYQEIWNHPDPEEEFLVIAPCYAPGTEILTDHGWMLFENLSGGERVATLQDGEMIFEYPKEIYHEPFRGNLVTIKNSFIDLKITPNHRMFYSENIDRRYESKRNFNWKIDSAENLFGRSVRFSRSAQWKGRAAKSPAWMEFLGFWFAEGYTRLHAGAYQTTLTQKIDNAGYVNNLLARAGIKHTKTGPAKNGIMRWHIYDRAIGKELIRYGKSKTKAVPDYVKNSSPELICAFLDGYIEGDGSTRNNQTFAATISRQLADDVQELCIKAGWSAGISIVNYKTYKNTLYRIAIYDRKRGKYPTIAKKDWGREYHDGLVHCVKVKGGIVLVRRNGKMVWCGNTYKMLMRATVPTMTRIFADTDCHGELKISNSCYQLPWGAKIWLGSADRPESLEAGQYRAAWLDEAGQMKYQAWYVIQARLGMHQGRAFITTTPYAVNWLYHEFYKRWRDGDEDYFLVQYPSIANPYYPQAEFERMKKTLTPELFEMRYCGQFRKMEGLVYRDFSQDHIVEPFEIPEDWRRVGGIDFGFNNPFVALRAAISPDDVMYIYYERYKPQTLLDEHAKALKPEKMPYFADPSGAQQIAELIHSGVIVNKADNDISTGIDAVNARIRTHRLRVFRTCANTIDEFEIYAFDPEKEKPVKLDDHCMDALRYLIMGADKQAVPRLRSLN